MSTMPSATPGDLVARGELTLVPGSLQRVRQMTALREQGYSLEEIASRFAVSRGRVRQILHAQGGPVSQDVSQARRRRDEQLAQQRVDELLALWRAGEQLPSAAAALGLPVPACRRTIAMVATEVDRAARRASLGGSRGAQTYSDRDIIEALTATAADLGRAPSAKEYAAAALGAQLPSLATVLNRMGGWSKAMAAAGLRPDTDPMRTRKRTRVWTEPACWRALRRVVDELGDFPSVLAYDRLATGRSDLPSSATIRKRLGRWSSLAVQVAAQRELAQQAPARAQSAGETVAGTMRPLVLANSGDEEGATGRRASSDGVSDFARLASKIAHSRTGERRATGDPGGCALGSPSSAIGVHVAALVLPRGPRIPRRDRMSHVEQL